MSKFNKQANLASSDYEAECKQLRKENAILRMYRDSYRTQLDAADAKAGRYATEAEDAEGLRRFQVGQLRARVAELEAALEPLLLRLCEWAADNLTDENVRDWCGHVEPPLERARAALNPPQEPPEATTDPL